MSYKRLATWILVAGLGLTAGCQTSSNSCSSPCSGGGGLMSRFGMGRSRRSCDANVVSMPVSDVPLGGCCDGGSCGGGSCAGGSCGATYGAFDGPTLGDPAFMGNPYPNMTAPPSTTLPPPMATDGLLRPVPGTVVPGTATPVPAGPSSRSRW